MVVDWRELDGGMHVWAAEGFMVGHLILCKTSVSVLLAIGGRYLSHRYAIQLPIPSLSLAGGCGVGQGPRRP